MVQRNDISRRVGFLESENLDPLYAGIGKIIGLPIDSLVIDISRRGTVDYFKTLIPLEARGGLSRETLDVDSVAAFMTTIGQLNGFGKYEIVDIRYKGEAGDHTVINVSEPFSLPLIAGTQAGGCEVISGSPHDASYREISPGIYEITSSVCTRDERLDERMPIKEYRHRDGDIELDKCPTCGGPAALSGFRWLLDRGIISNAHTRRRMVMMGPEVQDPLFEELGKELGEIVPAAVVEAQRRFVKTGFYSIEEIGDEGDFRTQLALRGYGNLREISMGAKGMRMRVDNAACYLMTAGLAQGLFEMAFDVDSHVEWELSEDGDLKVEVSPRGVKESVGV